MCLVAHAFLAEMAEVEPMRNVRVLCQFPNGTRMLMREELRKLVDLMPNAGLAVFLATPFSTDTAGKDYEVAGPITVENARSVCVNPDADFFVVGSRAFTEALRTDLVKLGIIHSRVHTQVL